MRWKSENVVGLQVADLVAYPITRHVLNPEGVNLAYDVLKNNIYQVDGKMYGMKVFPKEKLKRVANGNPFPTGDTPILIKRTLFDCKGNVFLSDMQMFDCIIVFVLEELTLTLYELHRECRLNRNLLRLTDYARRLRVANVLNNYLEISLS